MSSPSDVAHGFSISGLLDSASRTNGRFRVVEIPVGDIADHPGNAVYSMDEAGVRALADSIKENGLTDLPLVRKLPDGACQMISGHRRKAAYALLAQEDDAYARLPCRVAEGVDDARALALLHSANYFVRALTVTERAAATRALGLEVERLREEDPALTGRRTEDIKADIIAGQTGRRVSGKTIKREEALADKIAGSLADEWRAAADAGKLSARAVDALAALPRAEQSEVARSVGFDGDAEGASKRDLSARVMAAVGDGAGPDPSLARALGAVEAFSRRAGEPAPADLEALEEIAKTAGRIVSRARAGSEEPSKGVRAQS
jgi:ParB family chromosome partitioning protein